MEGFLSKQERQELLYELRLEREVKTNTGRQRININGVMNAHDPTDVLIDESDSINAQSTIRPNLNLIERLWRLLKKTVLYNRYFETYEEFRKTVLSFFKNIKRYRAELKTLMTLKFHIAA